MTHKPDTQPHELTEQEMLDPHGNVTHEHVILSTGTLLGVLVVLLFFTIMTVAASRAEIAIGDALNITIPQWVNVCIAMSIAVVKAILVALFFMQLKYDNKLNAIVAATCIGCLGLFLGFSMLDLATRGGINSQEQNNILAGGTWTSDKSITQIAKENYIKTHSPEEWAEEMALHHGDHHDDDHSSGKQQSRPQHGPTGLFEGGGSGH